VQVQGWKTTILPLAPALVAPSPAFSGSSGAGSAAAESQALQSFTCQCTSAELQALFCQVQDLLEAIGQQPVPMHTRQLHFPYKSAGVPVFCDQRGERVPGHVGRRGSHTLQCLVCKAHNRLVIVALWSMRAHNAAHILREHVTSDVFGFYGLHNCAAASTGEAGQAAGRSRTATGTTALKSCSQAPAQTLMAWTSEGNHLQDSDVEVKRRSSTTAPSPPALTCRPTS
jgi:hypothetical protein